MKIPEYIPETDLAKMAAYIDGEGCISIEEKSRNYNFKTQRRNSPELFLSVSVANCIKKEQVDIGLAFRRTFYKEGRRKHHWVHGGVPLEVVAQRRQMRTDLSHLKHGVDGIPGTLNPVIQ